MKFLIFIIVILSLWYGMRWLQQAEATRKINEQRDRDRRNAHKDTRRHAGAVDTVKCGQCGAYIPANRPTACGRGDCPYPAAA